MTTVDAVDPDRITGPVRMIWGTKDRLLPLPGAADRDREWFALADRIELDGVGHSPQLDAPIAASRLILDFTGR